MSTRNYHSLRDLRPGSYNWKIKVRIVRSWRGQGVKGLNVLLLDDKVLQIHTFSYNKITFSFFQIYYTMFYYLTPE